MRLHLVPCNAMAHGGFVAEDIGLIRTHQVALAWAGMKLKILLSYWYYKDVDLDELFAKYFERPYPEVFADSGGFSAYTRGVKIGWQDYAKWIRKYEHLFTVYANLDVIGNHAATMENQCALEGVGLRPIPVFHTGSDYADLEALVERYPYIALGGLVPYMRFPKRAMPHLIKCFRIAGDRSVFHGFGVTSWVILKALPWYSVDSSSWGQGFRYGQVPVFDERRGRFVKLRLGSRADWLQYGALVRSMGFNPEDFADRERNDRAKICAISALSYMKAEKWLRKRHGEIRVPGREVVSGASGDRLHLSDTNGSDSGNAYEGLKLHLVEHSLDRGG